MNGQQCVDGVLQFIADDALQIEPNDGKSTRRLIPLEDRGPLRVLFVITSMPIGGAETLLVNLIRRLDPSRCLPELCCLKSFGPLGELLSREIPACEKLLEHKYDLRIVSRLTDVIHKRRIDAVVTVGAGDKMFWGRLAAWRAAVPVILSALHSTGWPDGISRLNRLLTPITDGFIGVADAHGKYLVDGEHFPIEKVFVIPNGVDVDRFAPREDIAAVRQQLGLPTAGSLVGIVAALRPEKNIELFLRAAAQVRRSLPKAEFVIVGDGPRRKPLESLAVELGLSRIVHFLGTRSDVPNLLASLDVFLLTSRMEANPVSILEAMAMGKPVIAPRVGSIAETVADGVTGYLTDPGSEEQAVARTIQLLTDTKRARAMGIAARQTVIDQWSLNRMVHGYEELISQIYTSKVARERGQRLGAAQPGTRQARSSWR